MVRSWNNVMRCTSMFYYVLIILSYKLWHAHNATNNLLGWMRWSPPKLFKFEMVILCFSLKSNSSQFINSSRHHISTCLKRTTARQAYQFPCKIKNIIILHEIAKRLYSIMYFDRPYYAIRLPVYIKSSKLHAPMTFFSSKTTVTIFDWFRAPEAWRQVSCICDVTLSNDLRPMAEWFPFWLTQIMGQHRTASTRPWLESLSA